MTLGFMSESDRATWAAAQTLDELGEVTARWLTGEVASRYSYRPETGPSEETLPYVGVLAGLNRAGFVTDFSQPGSLPTRQASGAVMSFQRAAVGGYVSAELFRRIEASVSRSPLALMAYAPGQKVGRGERGALVSREYGRKLSWRKDPLAPDTVYDVSWSGYASPEDIRQTFGNFGNRMVAAVLGAYRVCVFDPEWGRNDVLWPFLEILVSILEDQTRA